MPTICTVGYQNRTPAELIALLNENRVGRVIDVRNNPVSRKRGFGRRQLQESLESNGIEYVHIPELGIPQTIRYATIYRGDVRSYRIYARHRIYRHAHRVVDLPRPARGRNCLLCLEENPAECHRSIIANRLRTKWGYHVMHL